MVVKAQASRASTVPNHGIGPLYKILLLAFALTLFPAGVAHASSESRIVVTDKLCLPGEEVHVEAYLYRRGILAAFRPQIQGESLRFIHPDGALIGSFLTDPSGMARIPYKADHPGQTSFTVQLAENHRYEATPAQGTVFVRHRNKPLFFILVEGGLTGESPSPLFQRDLSKAAPFQGSVEGTKRIASHSTLVLLTSLSPLRKHEMKAWLSRHDYPAAPLFSMSRPKSVELLMSGEQGMDTRMLESLRKNPDQPACLVTGNRTFAEAASEKDFSVYLLRSSPESGTDIPGKTDMDGKAVEKGTVKKEENPEDDPPASKEKREPFTSFQGWKEIPSECLGKKTRQ